MTNSTKVILKAVLWGIVSWLVLSLLLSFGVGFYKGYVSQDFGAEESKTTLFVLRFAALILALGVAAYVFMTESKKPEEVFTPPLARPKPLAPSFIPPKPPAPPAPAPQRPPVPTPQQTPPVSMQTPAFKPPVFQPRPPVAANPFPSPAPKPAVPPQPAPKPPVSLEPKVAPPPPISTPSYMPASQDLKKNPDQTPWS